MNDATGPGTGPTAAVVIPVQRATQASARRAILCRHARLTKAGRPIFCAPSRAELAGRAPLRQSAGTDGKVIYSTREAAEAAAREAGVAGCPPAAVLLVRPLPKRTLPPHHRHGRPPEHAPGPGVEPGAARPALGLTANGQMDPTSPAYTTTLSG